jgi:hypothetical protein
MISKKVLSEIVSKYSLGGHVEKVKWVVDEKDEIAIEFINDSKTLVGQVYYNNTIGLKKGNYLPRFTIETREGMTGNDLVFTIGTDITNTIQFSVDELHEVTEEFEQIPFDSNLFKEILKANRNYESGTVHINKKGLIQLTFNYNDGFNTHYYLVRLQENN